LFYVTVTQSHKTSGEQNSAVFIKHLRIANYLGRFERDTGVKILAYSRKSRSFFRPPPPSFFLIFQPLELGGVCALTPLMGLSPCMFGYLKLSMIVLNKRPQQWPNSSQKDVSLFLSQQTEPTQSNTPRHTNIFLG